MAPARVPARTADGGRRDARTHARTPGRGRTSGSSSRRPRRPRRSAARRPGGAAAPPRRVLGSRTAGPPGRRRREGVAAAARGPVGAGPGGRPAAPRPVPASSAGPCAGPVSGGPARPGLAAARGSERPQRRCFIQIRISFPDKLQQVECSRTTLSTSTWRRAS
ncbi:piercer of microtubule wall 1 protein isoform X4 [Moschus berezovskii]|uniref:piercer of microtubule wall 1 protein isoform X4 n=1 Tax=Moschus berezovskii TaxID=68408 RepID=UPI002443A245|nr:piercer of microtubule wall 1 protein isoform X4 [Moschus berezovskii]